MTKPFYLCLLILVFVLIPQFAYNQRIIYEDNRLTVGVIVEPPFVIKDEDGSFYGLSIDLWQFLAGELQLKYEFREYSNLWGLLRALTHNEIDITVNPMTVSGTRLQQFSVSQPFFISGVGVAVSRSRGNQLQTFFRTFSSPDFLKFILFIGIVIFVFGTLVWFIERKLLREKNHNDIDGILDGFWWAAVTMTTVGYGDKTPKTWLGRGIALIWMFTAVIIVSTFTATMTSTLTVNTLEHNIEHLEDLKHVKRIGTVMASSCEDYLTINRINIHSTFNSATQGLEALAEGKIDAFVYDKPILHYLIHENNYDNQIRVMSATFNKEYHSFIMPKNSVLLDKVNPELVDKIAMSSWGKTLTKYNLHREE